VSDKSATQSDSIKVLIVDDHPLVRKGLQAILLSLDDMEVVGQAADGEEAVRECARTMPDVVLMDLVMPVMDGATATAAIRRRCPDTQVLALTSFTDEETIEGALRAGAIGYVLKNVSGEALAGAIRAARAGQSTLAQEAVQALMRVASGPYQPGSDLSTREREVLALLADGMRNAEIATRLYLSPSTVKTHVSRIMAKLNVSTRTEAAALAIRKHLI